MTREPLREALAGHRPMLGTFNVIPSVDLAELLALSGFDFVVLDMEHGPFSWHEARQGIIAARAHDAYVIVRVRAAHAHLIGAALDIGADGVLVPGVGSAREAREVVAAARFAPEGERGANPWVSASGYGSTPDWFATANREVAVLVMVEGARAIDATAEILDVPGLDGVFLGPVDLSHSLGLPGQTEHPRIRTALEAVAAKAAERGKASAVFTAGPDQVRSWWSLGVDLVACGVDAGHIRTALSTLVSHVRGETPPTTPS